jgi:hypothetical protein
VAVEVSKVDVWVGEIEDRCGGLSEKIEAVAEAGANLEFVIARRASDRPGYGLVFVAPLHGNAQIRAAKAAGLMKDPRVHTLRIEGPSKLGFGAKITHAIAEAGINMRGMSGTALGRRCAIYVSFDNPADTARAKRVLMKALNNRSK